MKISAEPAVPIRPYVLPKTAQKRSFINDSATREKPKTLRSPVDLVSMLMEYEKESIAMAGTDARPIYYEDIVAARYETVSMFLRSQDATIEPLRLKNTAEAMSSTQKVVRDEFIAQYESVRSNIQGFDNIISRHLAFGYNKAVNTDIADAIRQVL